MVSIVIESAKKGSSEQNHIIRVLQLKKEDNIYIDKNNRKVIFYKMSGKSKLLKKENYNAIIQKADTLFFILDADEDYDETEKKIEKLIIDLKSISPNLKADYFISCNFATKKGNIESLLLSCVKESLKKCYSNFLECLGKEKLEKYSEKNILSKLFEIENPPYDINCEYLKPLKQKFYKL
jgi:hypothetical protein